MGVLSPENPTRGGRHYMGVPIVLRFWCRLAWSDPVMWLGKIGVLSPESPSPRPLLTSRSGSAPSPFQAQGEISPGKNALLRCTTAGFTPPRLDHKSFAVSCPLALLGSAFYPILVHRLAAYAPRFLPTFSHPHAVALHFVRCDQLTAGLAPAGVRPCWAHQKKPRQEPGLGRDKVGVPELCLLAISRLVNYSYFALTAGARPELLFHSSSAYPTFNLFAHQRGRHDQRISGMHSVVKGYRVLPGSH